MDLNYPQLDCGMLMVNRSNNHADVFFISKEE
nr:MAG TPA: hypothetical protein [Caudoviricetes sp.]